MNDKVLTADDEPIATALHALDRGAKNVGKLTENYRPTLGGERYLTDKEVSELLKVSRRTLQEYRNNRTLPYLHFGGKILYRECDIETMLAENYRKAIK